VTATASAAVTVTDAAPVWPWPVEAARYDRRPELTANEREALDRLGMNVRRRRGYDRDAPEWRTVERLLRPLDDARAALWCPDSRYYRRAITDAIGLVLLRCGEDNTAFWGWSDADWSRLIGTSATEFERPWPGWIDGTIRPYVTAYAYLLTGFTAFDRIGNFDKRPVAWRVFGRETVDGCIDRISDVLGTWGYRTRGAHDDRLRPAICMALLLNRSPLLEDLTTEAFERLRTHPQMSDWHVGALFGIQRAVATLGHCEPPSMSMHGSMPDIEGTPAPWADWVERWYATSTLTPKVRAIFRGVMAKVGRWLADQHPEIVEPSQWTRRTCAAWVAAVDRMDIGDYVQRTHGLSKRSGEPLSPRTKAGYLTATRTVFRDFQEWEWMPRRFDPTTALATPRSVLALVGPNPRVIADDVWAKLLWAGLNIEPDDLPTAASGPCYPIELVRAITLVWLFAGQRSDEIARLRLGCIRWQHDGMPIPGDSDEVLAQDAVCLLDIPTHKTGTAFTKPVDPLVGKAIEAWQAVRPDQPKMLDRKTSEHANFLFAFRARHVGKSYINAVIIPALCRKAGVPTADVRGNITSHRARSTIASQLYNAKEPMTLFELQAWLGHRSPASTQHYAKITPNTLARAYNDAGYFARNVRTIEVLVDRDAVTSGAAATGEPWQYYDLGRGYCTYTFFEQCPHRMACARCDFYTPKDSSKGQLLEAKENLQRMLASIPLTDDERAAVDEGQTALDQLLERLIDVPTPTGATPREIGVPATATLLPITPVNQGK
jgi:integrase